MPVYSEGEFEGALAARKRFYDMSFAAQSPALPRTIFTAAQPRTSRDVAVAATIGGKRSRGIDWNWQNPHGEWCLDLSSGRGIFALGRNNPTVSAAAACSTRCKSAYQRSLMSWPGAFNDPLRWSKRRCLARFLRRADPRQRRQNAGGRLSGDREGGGYLCCARAVWVIDQRRLVAGERAAKLSSKNSCANTIWLGEISSLVARIFDISAGSYEIETLGPRLCWPPHARRSQRRAAQKSFLAPVDSRRVQRRPVAGRVLGH
jgi:hypothetical protein